jgi:hypothetical protein
MSVRLFYAVDAGGNSLLLEALAQTGFFVVAREEFDGEDKFFCAVTGSRADNDSLWVKWRPRIVFAAEREGLNSGLYSWREIDLGGDRLQLGVLPDREFTMPKDWHLAYGADPGDDRAYAKALSDVSYRYILLELMDETAEWCGHMSSVVHKM